MVLCGPHFLVWSWGDGTLQDKVMQSSFEVDKGSAVEKYEWRPIPAANVSNSSTR